MKRKPRALIATRVHAPEATAASFRWQSVEKALIAAGFEVEVLTSKAPEGSPHVRDVARVKRWPVLRDREGNLRGYVQYLSYDIPLFFRLLAARRPDVALIEPPPTTGVVARVALALRRVPYIWYAADTWSSGAASMGAPRVVVRALRLMESMAIRGAAAVIAVTDGVERGVHGMGAKQVELIPNGIDTDLYRVADGESAQFPYPYFIYAGTASEFQGAEVFVDAFAEALKEHPNTQMVFLGSGSDWPLLEQRAADLNSRYSDGIPRMIVRSAVQPAEAAEILGGATASLVSIAPAHGKDAAYPTKILASLSSGTPVIFLGAGQAADDIQTYDLGWAAGYSSENAARMMGQALTTKHARSNPERLHRWVVNNRSSHQSAERVVALAEKVMR